MYVLPKGFKTSPVRRAKPKRKQPERHLQTRIAALLSRVLSPEIPWTAIGHGVFLTGDREQAQIRGGILKRMGVKPGWPDIIIYYRKLIGIELKARGAVTGSQEDVHTLITLQGGVIKVIHSEIELLDFLEVLGLPMIEKLPPAERAVLRAMATSRTARTAKRSDPDDGLPPLL